MDPRTGHVSAPYPTMSDEELRAAIDRADVAFGAWSGVDVGERSRFLRRVADLFDARAQELVRIQAREMGVAAADAEWQPGMAASHFRFFAEHGARFLADEPIEIPGGQAVVVKRPLGVILGIIAWNMPYLLFARFAAPTLMMGNTALLKPAPQCPQSAAAVQSLMRDAGVPDGVVEVVYSSHEQTELILGEPGVQGVSFTGSRDGGAVVASIAGRHLKRISLELGGSDPFVVLSGEDLDATVRDAVSQRLFNAGQVCSAPKRFIIADEVYDSFVDGYVRVMGELDRTGAPPADAAQPLASSTAADRLERQLARAVRHGATLIGGRRVGDTFAPGLLLDIPPDADVHDEEVFGPIGLAYRAKDEDDAVAIANRTSYGLGSYIYTHDTEQARRVAERIEAGMTFINRGGDASPQLPFGGVKASGNGRAGGRWAAEEFLNQKTIVTA